MPFCPSIVDRIFLSAKKNKVHLLMPRKDERWSELSQCWRRPRASSLQTSRHWVMATPFTVQEMSRLPYVFHRIIVSGVRFPPGG